MRAMKLSRPGQALQMIESPAVAPAAGQVQIAVHVCGVCRTDLHLVDGELPDPALPITPGHEIVGRVTALGEGVTGLQPGDRVGVSWLAWTCGSCEFCRRGSENICPSARFTGYQVNGGFATETTADARFAFKLPANYSDDAAAPLMCAGLIGWRALRAAGPGTGAAGVCVRATGR